MQLQQTNIIPTSLPRAFRGGKSNVGQANH
jgi:hypothetical protein